MTTSMLEILKEDFPIFELKNKLNVAKSIILSNGEEIVVPPKGTVKVLSSNINSFPDFVVFNYIKPTLTDLNDYDVLEKKSPKANAKLNADNGAELISAEDIDLDEVIDPALNPVKENTLTPSPGTDKPNTEEIDPLEAGNNTVHSPTSQKNIDGSNANATPNKSVSNAPKPAGQK